MNGQIRQGRRADTVIQLLRSKLNSLNADEMDKLPPERALAAEFGVSRRVIRQALDMLEAEGQIERVRGRGTSIVRETDVSQNGLTNLKQYTRPADLMETRLVLEPAIAGLAAIHASSKDLEDMRDYINKGRDAKDHTMWERWDGAFHKAIGRSTYNGLLIHFSDLLDAARAQTAWGRLRKASLTPQRQQLYTRQHEAILAAIASRDAGEATRTMRQHLLAVKRSLIDQIEDDESLDS